MSVKIRAVAPACVLAATAVIGLYVWLSSASPDSSDAYVPHAPGSLTFTKDIAPLVFKHCAGCHRRGESAPFSLLSYADIRSRAGQVADVVNRRLMPPWLPDPSGIEFVEQRVLSTEQIGMLRQWVEEGAVEGDPADLPPLPQSTAGWQLGEPDLVIQMPETYSLPAEGTDVFRNFVIPVDVPKTVYVHGVELRPGNPRIVHHGVLLIDRTPASRRLDQLDSESGFGGMVYGLSAHSPDGHFLGWTPGKMPFRAPAGMAWRLESGTDLVLQLHLLPTGKAESIRSTIGLFFSTTPPTQTPMMIRLGSKTINIPAGEKNYTITDEFRLPVDVEVLGVYPHAHYLGKEMHGFAKLPDATQRRLIDITEWDFNWQDEYRYVRPIFLPKGSRLAMRFTYDNTAENIRNPNNPPRRVVWGERSSDEMGDLWIQVLPRNTEQLALLKQAYARKNFYANVAGYEHALRVDPGDYKSHYNLGCSMEQLGQLDKAVAHFESALRINPDHAESLNNYGVVLCKQGRMAKAVPRFERAIRLRPDYPDARENLKRARKLLNQHVR